MGGRHQAAGFARAAGGILHRRVCGVRFRGGGEIDHRLRERQIALRTAEPLIGVPGGKGLGQRLRVGEADILAGEANQAAGDVARVLAAGEHAGEPVEGGIGVRAAQRLMQRRNQVEMFLAVAVVEGRAARQVRREVGGAQQRVGGEAVELLGHVQQIAAVAIGHGTQRRARGLIERQGGAADRLRAGEQGVQGSIVEAPQHQHLAAREQRAVQCEGRVFRGGADQHDRAVLHHGQETVLLRAVEAVDFVDEQQRGLAGGAPQPRILERAFEVGDAGEYGRHLMEMQPCGVGEQARDAGFADAGRAPQDQAGQLAARDHARQQAVGPDQVVLADNIAERGRAQAVGQRPRAVIRRGRRRRREQACLVGLRHLG